MSPHYTESIKFCNFIKRYCASVIKNNRVTKKEVSPYSIRILCDTLFAMISRFNHHGLTWIDLETPTREEIVHISEEFSIPSIVSDEMFTNSLRSKVDLYDNFIYLILHFPDINNNGVIEDDLEIDFIIGKNFLITVRYETVVPVAEFSSMFETSALHESVKNHGGILFAAMMKQIYKQCLNELELTTDSIRDIEHRIFDGQEEKMVKILSHTRRKLLDFKQATRFHTDILESYEAASTHFFGPDYNYYSTAIVSEFNKVNSVLHSHREVLSELQQTNDSLLSTKSNEIMKTFTILTFVMLPLSVITGVFGMNASFVFINNINDFFFIVAAMSITGLIMFVFFKLRKWL